MEINVCGYHQVYSMEMKIYVKVLPGERLISCDHVARLSYPHQNHRQTHRLPTSPVVHTSHPVDVLAVHQPLAVDRTTFPRTSRTLQPSLRCRLAYRRQEKSECHMTECARIAWWQVRVHMCKK